MLHNQSGRAKAPSGFAPQSTKWERSAPRRALASVGWLLVPPVSVRLSACLPAWLLCLALLCSLSPSAQSSESTIVRRAAAESALFKVVRARRPSSPMVEAHACTQSSTILMGGTPRGKGTLGAERERRRERALSRTHPPPPT